MGDLSRGLSGSVGGRGHGVGTGRLGKTLAQGRGKASSGEHVLGREQVVGLYEVVPPPGASSTVPLHLQNTRSKIK